MARRPDPALLASALLGLALVGLGAISLLASVVALPAQSTLEAIRRDQRVPAAAAAAAARRSMAAARWFETCRHLTDAALANSAAGSFQLSRTEVLAAESLARCPASPHNWLRIAGARLNAGRPEDARAAWRLSVLTGRYVPGLIEQRLELGLRLINGDDADFLALLSQQIRMAADLSPAQVEIVARRTKTEPFVRTIVAWPMTAIARGRGA